MFEIYRLNLGREIVTYRPTSAEDCKRYFSRNWPRYNLEMFEVSGDGLEIFIVIAKHDEHIRFHARKV